MKLSQVTNEALFCMFKGEPGTRKSTQALSFPGPQFWFSTDQKMEALLVPSKEWGIDNSQIDFEDFKSYDEVSIKLKQLQVNCPYKTLVIDSVTSLGDTINSQTIDVKQLAKKGQVIGGIPVNSIEDYKAEASGFRDVMRILKDIHRFHKTNIILIAHVVGERSKEETAITQQSRIIITGGKVISGKIAAYCTEVYHFDIKPSADVSQEGTYRLVTIHTGVDYARTALRLPSVINFGGKPIYENYLLPAITKLNTESPITTKQEKK